VEVKRSFQRDGTAYPIPENGKILRMQRTRGEYVAGIEKPILVFFEEIKKRVCEF
jgi:hypothetical protein